RDHAPHQRSRFHPRDCVRWSRRTRPSARRVHHRPRRRRYRRIHRSLWRASDPRAEVISQTQRCRDSRRRHHRPGPTMKIAFVVSEFNSEVTAPMEQRARRHAESLGVEVARVVLVPGVYDMAPVVKALLQRKEIDGVVMIGAVIKGETLHDELISHAIADAGIRLSIEFDKPVGLAITGPGMTGDQAVARIDNAKNGVEAVVRVARALKEIRG